MVCGEERRFHCGARQKRLGPSRIDFYICVLASRLIHVFFASQCVIFIRSQQGRHDQLHLMEEKEAQGKGT